MKMWIIIMLTALLMTGIALLYLSWRVSLFDLIGSADLPKWRRFIRGLLLVVLLFVIVGKLLNPVNAIVCVFYLAMIWLLCDFGFDIIRKIFFFD